MFISVLLAAGEKLGMSKHWMNSKLMKNIDFPDSYFFRILTRRYDRSWTNNHHVWVKDLGFSIRISGNDSVSNNCLLFYQIISCGIYYSKINRAWNDKMTQVFAQVESEWNMIRVSVLYDVLSSFLYKAIRSLSRSLIPYFQ